MTGGAVLLIYMYICMWYDLFYDGSPLLASGLSIDLYTCSLWGIDLHTILALVWQLVRLIQERIGQLACSERRINRETHTHN